jgi:hypothetical protein
MNLSVINRDEMIKLVAAEIARLGAARDYTTGYQAAITVGKAHPEWNWDTGHYMIIGEIWQTDPDLQAELERLREARGEVGFGWTKREYIENLRATIEAAREPKDKINGLRLFADVAGFMPDKAGPSVTVNTNVGIANNVMRLPPEPTNIDEWELKTVRQQSKLIEHASGPDA